MDNPLFNTNSYSPSPGGPSYHRNPVWSAEVKPKRGSDPDQQDPASTVKGMRALGLLQSPHIQEFYSNVDISLHEDSSNHYTSLSHAAAAAMGRDRPEEHHFALTLSKLAAGDISIADAIASYAEICKNRAIELKELAAAQLQRAPRYMALLETAAELDAESATWQLLWYLYAIPDRDFPAGKGGNFVEGAGFFKTYRQHAADLLYEDAELNRAGRAIAWLESLAAANDPEPEQGLARKDGLWQETKGKLGAGPAALTLQSMRNLTPQQVAGASSTSTPDLVTLLDPDATTRQHRKLDGDNIKDENRLMKMVWRLIRSGRVNRAVAACIYAGQPWRAASMAFAGSHGALPLGASAEEADVDVDGDTEQSEAMSGEVTRGLIVSRGLWRWACYRASERISSTNAATGMGIHEAAVYAMLCGNLPKALHACASWEDTLWAHLRCWLECAVDAEIAAAVENGSNGDGSDSSDANFISMDILPKRFRKSNSGAYGIQDGRAMNSDDHGVAIETFKEGLAIESMPSASMGNSTTMPWHAKVTWPIKKVTDELPKTFEEAMERGGHDASSRNAATIQQVYRRMQVDLIQEKIEELVMDVLVRLVIDGIASASQQHQQQQLQGEESGPPCSPSLMRCAAHLALTFYALDVASADSPGRVFQRPHHPGTSQSQLHDAMQRLIQAYAVHLIDTGVYSHAPLYACHLRAGLRRSTNLLYLEHLTALGDIEACKAAHDAMVHCFDAHADQIIDAISSNEIYTIIHEALLKGHMESIGGPVQRALYLSWLCFAEASHAKAVRWACTLCREYSLGGLGGINAAMRLFTDIIPRSMGVALTDGIMETDDPTMAGVPREADVAVDGVELLLASAEHAGALAESRELRFWRRYFEIESEVASWEVVYTATVEEMQVLGEQPTSLIELARDTMPLLEAVLEFLKEDPSSGWLVMPINDGEYIDALDGMQNTSPLPGGESGGGHDGTEEIAVVLGPDHGMDDVPAVLSGESYPTFASSREQSEAAIALVNAFESAAGKLGLGDALAFHAGAAPEEGVVQLPGLVSLAIDCKGGDSVQSAAVMLLASALKGSLAVAGAGGMALGPFVASNISANSKVRSLLCQTVCYPRLAIKAAALRQAIAYMGLCEGDAVLKEIADVLVQHEGILGLFNDNEIAAVKQQDSAATALIKRHIEGL